MLTLVHTGPIFWGNKYWINKGLKSVKRTNKIVLHSSAQQDTNIWKMFLPVWVQFCTVYRCVYFDVNTSLTLILLTWKIVWGPNNSSRWQMEINSAFKGLKSVRVPSMFENSSVTKSVPIRFAKHFHYVFVRSEPVWYYWIEQGWKFVVRSRSYPPLPHPSSGVTN